MRLDGHAHVFLKTLEMTPNRRYTPKADATPGALFSLLSKENLDGAVLVQPSFLGTNNSYLSSVLSDARSKSTGPVLYGVCMLNPETDRATIEDLKTKGFIGLRLNFIGKNIPDLSRPEWQSFLNSISRVGWHIEIHIEHDRLDGLLKQMKVPINIILDHFCLAPNIETLQATLTQALKRVTQSHLYVKASAPYRLPADQNNANTISAYLNTLTEKIGSDHIIWGSDWPFTQHENTQYYSKITHESSTRFDELNIPFAHFPSQLLSCQTNEQQ